jgi:hypothetical protein
METQVIIRCETTSQIQHQVLCFSNEFHIFFFFWQNYGCSGVAQIRVIFFLESGHMYDLGVLHRKGEARRCVARTQRGGKGGFCLRFEI